MASLATDDTLEKQHARDKKEVDAINKRIAASVSPTPPFLLDAVAKGLPFEQHTPSSNRALAEEAAAKYKEQSKKVRSVNLFGDEGAALFHTPAEMAISVKQEVADIVTVADDLLTSMENGLDWDPEVENLNLYDRLEELNENASFMDRVEYLMSKPDDLHVTAHDFTVPYVSDDLRARPINIPIKF